MKKKNNSLRTKKISPSKIVLVLTLAIFMLAVSFFSSFATVYIIDPSIKEFFLGKGDESVQVLLQIDAQPSNDSDIKNERDASSKNQ